MLLRSAQCNWITQGQPLGSGQGQAYGWVGNRATDLDHARAAADLRELLYRMRQAVRYVKPATRVLCYAAAAVGVLASCALQRHDLLRRCRTAQQRC